MIDIRYLHQNPHIMGDRIDAVQGYVQVVAMDHANSEEVIQAAAGLRALFAGVVLISGENTSALAGGFLAAHKVLTDLHENPMITTEVAAVYTTAYHLITAEETL